MKLPLDAQRAVGNTAPKKKAQDSEVNIPTGSLVEEENRIYSETIGM